MNGDYFWLQFDGNLATGLRIVRATGDNDVCEFVNPNGIHRIDASRVVRLFADQQRLVSSLLALVEVLDPYSVPGDYGIAIRDEAVQTLRSMGYDVR